MNPVIEIVIVGNEILSGRTKEANAGYMQSVLKKAGYDVCFISIVGDRIDDIADMLAFAADRADVVLVSGGLGPTSDDVTMEALARAFGIGLMLDENVLKHISVMFRRRGRFMSESNRKQAMIPEGGVVLDNPLGTAPGLFLKPVGSDASIFVMPGVPRELRTIFDESVLPRIAGTFGVSPVEVATVSVAGISESQLYDTIKHLPGAAAALSFYPMYSGIEVLIRTDEHSPATASELRSDIVKLLGDHVFSTSGEPMEKAVARMLLEKKVTVGIAESCTGGLIANRLTDIPGSSDYMKCGIVAYSNESKIDVLGVDPGSIARFGAVSAEVAGEMAEGVRRIAAADIGISTTGIAGPGGATPGKPVGLMFTAISSVDGTHTKKLQFVEDRRINKNRMSQAVLDLVRHWLLGL